MEGELASKLASVLSNFLFEYLNLKISLFYSFHDIIILNKVKVLWDIVAGHITGMEILT